MDTDMMTYTEQIAKIRTVRLGWDDHGIFTCHIDLDYGGGSGQGVGCYCLDHPLRGKDGESISRGGTAYGMEWIIRLMRACGVDDFAKVQGTTLIALRDDAFAGKVRGLKPLPTETGEAFVFDELASNFGVGYPLTLAADEVEAVRE